MTEFTKLTPSYQGGEFAKPEHVIEVQEAFAPIESELADHEERVTAAESDIATLTEDTTPLVETFDRFLLPIKFQDHILGWGRDRNVAKYAQKSIVCVGDSITQGQAADVDTHAITDWRKYGWVAQIRDMFAIRYGDVGEGYIGNLDPRVTLSGAQAIPSVGVGGTGQRINSGDTMTFALPACTEIRILWWWESNAASAAFTYTIDGGGSATATAPSGSNLYPVEIITGLSDATHTLVITGPATRYADIAGVVVTKTQQGGVLVHRVANAGGRINSSTGGIWVSDATARTRTLKLTFESLAADLAIIGFGTNEGGSGQGSGDNPTSWTAMMTDVVNYTASISLPTILTATTQRGDVLTGPFYPDDFFDAALAIAENNAHVAFLDMREIWPTPQYMEDNGLEYADHVHPSLLGHGEIARSLFSMIG